MSEKRMRAEEMLKSLTDLMPPMVKNLLPVFLMQYQRYLDNVTDEQITEVLNEIRAKLDYIETGDFNG